MSYAARPAAAAGETSFSHKMLFWASFFTLIAAGMGFSIRGDILGDWGRDFGFTKGEIGEILGMGLFGFGVTIIAFSFLADLFGYGRLMIIAFLLHIASVGFTLLAPVAYSHPDWGQFGGKSGAYWCLYVGQLCFSLANGTCEAVINPLTATLFPKNKTHWLNILHAGWPGGLVLGALVALALNKVKDIAGVTWVTWEVKWGIIVLPMILYGLMMIGRSFPKSEAKTSGVPLGQMVLSLFAPILLFLFLLHGLVGYVELGTDSWITDITKTVLNNKTEALLAFIWTNVLMFTLRFFAGPIVHKISPVGLLFISAVLGTAGLYLLGQPFTNSTWPWIAAVTIYGIGKTFYWPTLLGVISERYPKAGALALGISGGTGMIIAGLLGGPGIGHKLDYAAVTKLQDHAAVYERYKSYETVGTPTVDNYYKLDAQGKKIPNEKGTLAFTGLIPRVAGLDGARVGTLLGDPGENNGNGKTLETELKNYTEKGGKLEDKPSLYHLNEWWSQEGAPNAANDQKVVGDAIYFGAKKALYWTAAVPAALAIGFLLLLIVFKLQGGYKQVHIDDKH